MVVLGGQALLMSEAPLYSLYRRPLNSCPGRNLFWETGKILVGHMGDPSMSIDFEFDTESCTLRLSDNVA